MLTGNRYLPFSANRYQVNQYGNILNNFNDVEPVTIDGKPHVELEWVLGKRFYAVDLLVIVAFEILSYDPVYYLDVIVLHRDGDDYNNYPANLTYKFAKPTECHVHDGFYLIPGYSRYRINYSGDIISANDGRKKIWSITKPCRRRNSLGGYRYMRVVPDNGRTAQLFRHKALCLTFKDYSHDFEKLVNNHIDGIPGNDDLDNLEWATYSENNNHAYRLGLKRTGFKSVLAKDLKTGKVTKHHSISSCAKSHGHARGDYIRHRLENTPDVVYPDMMLFKYDDNSEWPSVDITNICRIGHGCEFLAKNVFTNEIILFKSATRGSELTGVKTDTITLHARTASVLPIMGYIFRYAISEINWPEYSSRHLDVFKHCPIKCGQYYLADDETTGEELFFPNLAKILEWSGLTKSGLSYYANTIKLFKGRYKIKSVNIKKELGPVKE